MTETSRPSARLSIDIDPDLRQRLKAAAAPGVTVRAFVETTLRDKLGSSTTPAGVRTQGWQVTPAGQRRRPRTQEEARAFMDELVRLQGAILETYGPWEISSLKLLHEAREERTSQLMGQE